MGKKDPNKPKCAKSAYNYFTDELREQRKADGESCDIGTVSKLSSDKWKVLSEEERKPYVKLSEKDKKRYQKDMESYIPPSDSDSDDDRPKKKKKKKDPNAPKRNQSAYFLFSNANRQDVKKELGDGCKITEIASALGEKWRGMTSDDKVPFEKLAAKDKERYQREMEVWNSR